MMTTDPTKAVVDVQEVKTLIGETRICWGCLSLTCRTRQLLSQKILGKKLVNKYCPVKKVLLGDRNLTRSLKGKVEKDNYVYVNHDPTMRKPFNKFQKGKKSEWQNWTASIVPRPADPTPTEKIVRANFTGLTDDDLFGPAFLY